jgi:hypothetical protein
MRLFLDHLLSGLKYSLIGTGPIAGIEIEEGRGGGAIIIFELPLRFSLPQGAGHKNLEDFRMDDHHGVGWDWTFETNKYDMIGLRARNLTHRIRMGSGWNLGVTPGYVWSIMLCEEN